MQHCVSLCVMCVLQETESPPHSVSLSACRKTIQSLGTEGHNEVAAPLGWPGIAGTGREITSQRVSVSVFVYVCVCVCVTSFSN